MKKWFNFLVMLVVVLQVSGVAASPVNSIKAGKLVQVRSVIKPYLLELKTQKSELMYYGTYHTVNPRCPQFADIEKRWQDFKPDLAFCEGKIWPLKKSRLLAIRLYGEQGLLRFLADRDKVKICCLEPPRDRELSHLLKKFSAEKIKIYYILRQAVVNRVLKRNIKNLDYVNVLLHNFRRNRRFKHDIYNLGDFQSRVRDLFPEVEQWQKMPLYYFNIQKHQGWLAQMHKRLNEFRDNYMLKMINKAIKKGKRIFAVVGQNHVINQEPTLRMLYTPGLANNSAGPKQEK